MKREVPYFSLKAFGGGLFGTFSGQNYFAAFARKDHAVMGACHIRQ